MRPAACFLPFCRDMRSSDWPSIHAVVSKRAKISCQLLPFCRDVRLAPPPVQTCRWFHPYPISPTIASNPSSATKGYDQSEHCLQNSWSRGMSFWAGQRMQMRMRVWVQLTTRTLEAGVLAGVSACRI